jgi:hypothetical protein
MLLFYSYRCGSNQDEDEDYWFFYHDALSLMTAKDTLRRVTTSIGYCLRMDFKKMTPTPKSTKDDLWVIDCMELMPWWDNHLDQDVPISVERHVASTSFCRLVTKKEFDMSLVPQKRRRCIRYLRILVDPGANGSVCPKSKRIVGDVKKVLDSMEIIRAAGEIIAEGCGSRHGGGRCWQEQAGAGSGGKRWALF